MLKTIFEVDEGRNLNKWTIEQEGARGVYGGAHGVNGGARGVMVIFVGNGHGDTSSNPGPGLLHFT